MTSKNTEAEQIELWKAHAAIIQTIRSAVPSFAHYESFTRNKSRIQKKIEEALLGYRVYVSVDADGRYAYITVHGTGINWVDALRISFRLADGQRWVYELLEDLKRQDPTDALERYEAEKLILQDLIHLDNTIRACKETAARLIESLPIPPTAVAQNFRSGPHSWSSLSYIRLDSFPNLYPK